MSMPARASTRTDSESVQVSDRVLVSVLFHPIEGREQFRGRVEEYDDAADAYGVRLDGTEETLVYVGGDHVEPASAASPA